LAPLGTLTDPSAVGGSSEPADPLAPDLSLGAGDGSLSSLNGDSSAAPPFGNLPLTGVGVGGPAAPEPSTWAMMIAGAATLCLFRRRRLAAALKSAIG
jgi:hypothetical protein